MSILTSALIERYLSNKFLKNKNKKLPGKEGWGRMEQKFYSPTELLGASLLSVAVYDFRVS